MGTLAKNVRELEVYGTAFTAAMDILKISKSFPASERYALRDQILRSSRSVCSNLSEGWHKRRYIAAFINKITDSVQEASETQTWLDFALASGYIVTETYDDLMERYEHIIAQLLTMERMAESFCKKR